MILVSKVGSWKDVSMPMSTAAAEIGVSRGERMIRPAARAINEARIHMQGRSGWSAPMHVRGGWGRRRQRTIPPFDARVCRLQDSAWGGSGIAASIQV